MKKGTFDPRAPRRQPGGRAEGSRFGPSGQPITGRILHVVRGQGHGFIRTDEGQKLFFHLSEVADKAFTDLSAGDVVTCEAIADGVSGPRAVKVRKA
jgi:cold shock CspA family protein